MFEVDWNSSINRATFSKLSFKHVVSETASNDFKIITIGIMILINYSMLKKMGFFISTTMIYDSLRDFPSRFTKIIISTVLFWTFTPINSIMFVFTFSPILNIKLSARFLTSKCNLRLNVIRKIVI